ncbi:MAG: S46 family peptidase [Planctomycetota bacterium]
MNKTKLILAAIVAICCTALSARSVNGDEGMWLFNALPVEHLKENYGFEPDDKWTEHLMKSSVRFNVGGSASFVSSNGLVLTNHHVGHDTIAKLSSEENNYVEDGFLAGSMSDELEAPDLELNQLVNIQDVTDQVNAAVADDMTVADAAQARRKVIGEIEQQANEESGLRSNVITLFGGGRYHLYQFKRFTDVRLVWCPESSAAFFGGDYDNFNYPRYCLDACLFRVYEDGEPAEIEHFLKWSPDGPEENEVVFVSGNPGRTSRIFTVDALKFQRDSYLPYALDFYRRREILLQQYSLKGMEQDRRGKDELFGVQNARKLLIGKLQGLQDPVLMNAKIEAEQELREQIRANPELAEADSAFETIAEIQRTKAERMGTGIRLNSRLFSIAQTIVQLAEEDTKPSAERLPQFRDSSRASLEQQLFSAAPIYQDLELVLMADSIGRTVELLGADAEICQMILAGTSPNQRASDVILGTRLDDIEFRKELVSGGMQAIEDCDDPMIQLARDVDAFVRAEDKENEELAEAERQAYAKIAEALFAIQGTSTYPDATFSLRLSFGPVSGYELNGEDIPAWTKMSDVFTHMENHEGLEDYQLPQRWMERRDRIKPNTPYNFVCTADIIGGNSGSPVVNKDLELVGLIFDGNLQSLPGDYQYDDRQARSVSVHSSAIREALEYVYDAGHLVEQLGK